MSRSFREKYRKDGANKEEAKKLQRRHPGPNTAFCAGALLQIAETFPGTPAAEEALIWIATHLLYGSMAERAKEMIARDHARSDKLEPLISQRQIVMVGSKPTERLLRAVLAENANLTIKGFACYYLARYLDHRGVIRYKHVARQEFFENGVTRFLKELADEKGKSKKKE